MTYLRTNWSYCCANCSKPWRNWTTRSTSLFSTNLQRSLNERGSDVHRIEGDKFKLCREVSSTKRRQLVVEHDKGNKPSAAHELTEAEENKLFEENWNDWPLLRGLPTDPLSEDYPVDHPPRATPRTIPRTNPTTLRNNQPHYFTFKPTCSTCTIKTASVFFFSYSPHSASVAILSTETKSKREPKASQYPAVLTLP